MNCFDKTRRLLEKEDYDYVFKRARRLVTAEFTVFFCSNSVNQARLGLALSKKMIAKAHDRNRLKRLLREAFRTACLPAIDVIFLARPRVAELENKTLIAKLSEVWNKLTALYGK